jgi:hypothetical protein
LLGAAVDDEQVSIDEHLCNNNRPVLKCSGIAIYWEVENFYSLYNSEDNMLAPQKKCPLCLCPDYCWESPYHSSENDHPLGAYLIKNIIYVPLYYNEYSVGYAIGFNDDANGDGECDLVFEGFCTIIYGGDNHFGYMGYRNSINPQRISDSGAMEFVVLDWRNENN